MTTLQRHGELWVIQPTRRGFRAECFRLGITATAPTYEALVEEIDLVFTLLCV